MGWRDRLYRRAKPLLPWTARDMIELRLAPGSGLLERGWPESRRRGLPVDKDQKPLPWYTYPAIRFLETRIDPSSEVFEYGMGYSTLWWAARAAHVTSCEHDEGWFSLLRPKLPRNVTAHVWPQGSPEYVSAAAAAPKPIDILVIDGRRRVDCALNGLGRLSPRGCVIWDNSDRPWYEPGFDHLARNGFTGRLDFWGMGPINVYEWCTSVFYRRENCLGV